MKTRETVRVPLPAERRREAVAVRLMPTKIQAAQRDRVAVVYVRQSIPQPVIENRESTARLYALAKLGYSAEDIAEAATVRARAAPVSR
jgi:hypothetical protein